MTRARRLFALLLPLAAVGVAAAWVPWRWDVTVFVAALAIVGVLGVIGPFGPARADRAARLSRAAVYLLVGVLVAECAAMMAHKSNADLGGAAVLVVMFAGYLAAAQAVTTYRSSVPAHALLAGLTGGFAAAGAWLVVVVLVPPIPPDLTAAVVCIGLGMIVTGIVDGWRAGQTGGLDAALIVGTTGTLVILNLLAALSVVGPGRLIPHLMPPALSAADQVANSRIELTDHYLWLLLLGWFVALTQCIAARAGQMTARPPVRPASPAG